MKETFGERLKELRLEKKLGQVELAVAIGVSKGNISKWENNLTVPSSTAIGLLSKLFNVSADYLLGLTDDQTPNWD